MQIDEGIEPSGELGEDHSEAPIDNGIFSYLNLIKLSRSNYEVRIIVIIITTRKMFRMVLQITPNQDYIGAKYVKY